MSSSGSFGDCGASTCAIGWALDAFATVSTVETPSTGASSAATAAGSAASTTMSMASGDSACAADTHLAVEALSLPSRCSATIRTLDMGKTSCGAGFNPPSESVGAADGGSGPALPEALLLQCGNQDQKSTRLTSSHYCAHRM